LLWLLGHLFELPIDLFYNFHRLRHLLLQMCRGAHVLLPCLWCRLPSIRGLSCAWCVLAILDLHRQGSLLLLGCAAYILGDQVLYLVCVVTCSHRVVVGTQVLRLLCLVCGRPRLLLLLLRRHHHILLEVTRRKDKVDGILTFLLTEVLLEELGYGVFDTLQVD
jgi:hypothetical protein